MESIFGDVDETMPELQILDRLSSPYDLVEAIQLYHEHLADGLSEQAAIERALEEVVPLTWLNI
jgi:hypothetical protein